MPKQYSFNPASSSRETVTGLLTLVVSALGAYAMTAVLLRSLKLEPFAVQLTIEGMEATQITSLLAVVLLFVTGTFAVSRFVCSVFAASFSSSSLGAQMTSSLSVMAIVSGCAEGEVFRALVIGLPAALLSLVLVRRGETTSGPHTLGA